MKKVKKNKKAKLNLEILELEAKVAPGNFTAFCTDDPTGAEC